MRVRGWPIVLAVAAAWTGLPPSWTRATGVTTTGRIGAGDYTRTQVRAGSIAHLQRAGVTFFARDGGTYTVRGPIGAQGGGPAPGATVRVAHDPTSRP